MIFCTIGTQASFDRLIEIVDKLAGEIDEEIIVQTLNGSYKPQNVKTVGLLSPENFDDIFNRARLIIAHAGMGTIISALEREKPIIIFPRLAKLGEHRNDHQLATADQMHKLGYVYLAKDADSIKNFISQQNISPKQKLNKIASQSLVDELHSVIG